MTVRRTRLGRAAAELLTLPVACAALLVAGAGSVPATTLPSNHRPATTPLVQPVAVFGRDDRVQLPGKLAALETKIGLLYDRRTRSVCTAFCVSERIIATAGHCVFRTSEEKPPPLGGYLFRLRGVKPEASSSIAAAANGGGSQNVLSGAMRINTRPPIDASRDWALLKLTKPVCSKGVLRLTRRSPEELMQLGKAKQIYQVAYHRDFANWKLAYGPACEVRRDFEKAPWGNIARDFTEANHLVLHTCDTGGASSGSPLLTDGPQGPEVVGINVGTYVQSRVLMQEGEVIKRFKADTVANTGVSTSAFAGKLDAFQRAEILGKPDDLKQLQLMLASRGLYRGKADGTYGPQLRAAIEAFEREENRPVTGLATVALLQRLSVVASGAPKPATVKIEGEGLISRGQKTRRER
ncbi:MAG: peptidoglycan-binding protein [Hyphomicrobiaceae bacterium]|nr:peptidoglycan-binding protein [Hyphomicrobiaceae bacterium]